MKTSDLDYSLPPELIAQMPIEPRDHSRLLVVDRRDGSLEHRRFYEIGDYLRAGDVLVFNDSRVIPARLVGKKTATGGDVEILLLRQIKSDTWETLVKPAKRIRIGTTIEIASHSENGSSCKLEAEAVGLGEDGTRLMRFSDESLLPKLGSIPLPPYIHTPLHDPERYQTVYARVAGSAAAPTAGLHFTRELIKTLTEKGIVCLFVTLHVGLDTFRPIRGDDPLAHHIHREFGVVSQETATELSRAKKEYRRIIGVGTTAVRLVEAIAQANQNGHVEPFSDWVDLFIVPGHKFRMIEAMITNFHLPRTTLLMLVSAFAGDSLIRRAYQEAIDQRYRFYSFGDAMLIF